MSDNYDRHDFFRIAVPGYIFLLVVGVYWIYLQGNTVLGDWKNLLTILIAGFPIGFIIQAVYLAWHVLRDLEDLDGKEGYCIRNELKTIKKEYLLEKDFLNIDKLSKNSQLSWCLETFLILENENEYRERSHELVSRVHSFGAVLFSILLGNVFTFLLILTGYTHPEFKSCFMPCILFIIWGLVIIFLWKIREHTKNVFSAMCRNFVRRKINKIALFIENVEVLGTVHPPGTGQ